MCISWDDPHNSLERLWIPNWEHLLVVCTWELRITKPAYRFSTLGPGSKPEKNLNHGKYTRLLNFDDVTYSVTGVPIKSR